jgi:predicted nucleic acid-binding protein
MAGHPTYTAILDACVLYPLATADALMSLTAAGLFAAKWTTRIESEWIRALEADRPDLKGRLELRRDAMRLAAVDWQVPARAWRRIEPSLSLPDSNDAHVLAAAIAGHADGIVTSNLKDFPAEILDEYGIEAIHPDTFILNYFDLDLLTTLSAFKLMRARRRKPAESPLDFAAALERNGLPQTAERLREAADLI